MNDISVIRFTNSPSKRRINTPRILPFILLVLASASLVFPRCCASFNLLGEGSFWSIRNSGGRNNAGFRLHNQRTASKKSRSSRLSSSKSTFDATQQNDPVLRPEMVFPTHRPLLAIITENDACDTEEKMKHTYETVKKATSTGKVDLVSVRLSLPSSCDENGDESQSYLQVLERAYRLTKKLVSLSDKQKREQQLQNHNEDKKKGSNIDVKSESSFVVVCSSDLVGVAVDACANGVHVKEHHLDRLPDIVRQFGYPIVIGTSTHSVESALNSYFCTDDYSEYAHEEKDSTRVKVTRPKPHYYFVGTCYLTESHPEKTMQSQLEGPELPGRVKRALRDGFESSQLNTESTIDDSGEDVTPKSDLRFPRIMAIGGIDETNCNGPVALGADGVAVIRAVLQADCPVERVEDMQAVMSRSYNRVSNE